MPSLNELGYLGLVIGLVAAAAAYFIFQMYRQLSAKHDATALELEEAIAHAGQLEERLSAESLKAKEVEASAPPDKVGKSEKKKKKGDRSNKEQGKARSMETQLKNARLSMASSQEILRGRDEDVRKLREEIESLHVQLAEKAPAIDRKSQPPKEVPEPVEEPTPVESEPVAPSMSEAEAEARVRTAEEQATQADHARREAVGRANLAEFELKKTRERLERLDKRSHEILDRLLKAERDARSFTRRFEALELIFQGLKGKYEVAHDTLLSFRKQFKVEIPTAAGVDLNAAIEDVVELEEEVRPARPRRVHRRRDSSPTTEAVPERRKETGQKEPSGSDAASGKGGTQSGGEEAQPGVLESEAGVRDSSADEGTLDTEKVRGQSAQVADDEAPVSSASVEDADASSPTISSDADAGEEKASPAVSSSNT